MGTYICCIYNYLLGVRCITLTWNGRNSIADGISESCTGDGLTNFGIKAVKEMNKLGMLIDVSHISEAGFWNVLSISEHPVMATHSNCFSLCSNPRNLSDDQIIALAKKRGIIGLTLVPDFISTSNADLNKYLEHFDHIVDLVGPDYICIGSDFDGVDKTIPETSDCSKLPRLTEGLLKRAYKETDIVKILGGSMMRLLEEVIG